MLVFLWMCVATSAFMPHGDRVVSYYTAAVEDYFDTILGDSARPAAPAKVSQRIARAA